MRGKLAWANTPGMKPIYSKVLRSKAIGNPHGVKVLNLLLQVLQRITGGAQLVVHPGQARHGILDGEFI